MKKVRLFDAFLVAVITLLLAYNIIKEIINQPIIKDLIVETFLE